jgi:hypothetical protein
MDLENLQLKYTNLLAQYKSAVNEYTNFLSQQAGKPCSKYSGESRNIRKDCYQSIWNRSGCTTAAFNSQSQAWIQNQTLNDIIYKSFLWATNTTPIHRQQCYGNSTKYSTATEPDYKFYKPELVAMDGYAFNGTGVLGQSNATRLQDCQAQCANLPNCSGATFVSNRCSLRRGDSAIVSAPKGSYAIVPKGKQLLLNMENINRELIAVNKELVTKFQMGGPILNRNITENKDNTNKLTKNYKKLMAERDEILNSLREYETLGTTENENEIIIYKNYYSYILLSILAISLLFLLYTFYSQSSPANTSTVQYGGKLTMTTYYIIIFMVILIVGINYSMTAQKV